MLSIRESFLIIIEWASFKVCLIQAILGHRHSEALILSPGTELVASDLPSLKNITSTDLHTASPAVICFKIEALGRYNYFPMIKV